MCKYTKDVLMEHNLRELEEVKSIPLLPCEGIDFERIAEKFTEYELFFYTVKEMEPHTEQPTIWLYVSLDKCENILVHEENAIRGLGFIMVFDSENSIRCNLEKVKKWSDVKRLEGLRDNLKRREIWREYLKDYNTQKEERRNRKHTAVM